MDQARSFLKALFVSAFLLSPFSAQALPVNFNQAWFKNDYATQYLDNFYDSKEVKRIFQLAKDAGSTEVRLWFFEGSHFPMLEWKNGAMVGLRADYIRNVLETLKIAREMNIRVYMTLLDAHSYFPLKTPRHEMRLLRTIYRTLDGNPFLEHGLTPLLKAISEAGLQSTISKIDVSNEMDTVVKRFGFRHSWRGASSMLCHWRKTIQSVNGFEKTPVTFSVRLHPLVFLPSDILSDYGPLACADFLDFHSYHDVGLIKKCETIRAYSSRDGAKNVVLGEFGQSFFNHRYSDSLQVNNTSNYLYNAKYCGFKEAIAWRLSDERPGYNKEARYSYEAYGKPRPAYEVIRQHNLSSSSPSP